MAVRFVIQLIQFSFIRELSLVASVAVQWHMKSLDWWYRPLIGIHLVVIFILVHIKSPPSDAEQLSYYGIIAH